MSRFTPEFIATVSDVATSLVEEIVALTSQITEIPAPTNDEAERAAFVRELLVKEGYADVTIDELSDVVGRLPGKDGAKGPLLLAGHTDTVFPRSVPIQVERRNGLLHAPGIGDNTVSVATLALLKKAFDQLGITPAVDVLVTGNVGEEGLGDLRGIRAVVDAHPELGAVIAVEGHSLGRVTNKGIGSKRLKVTVTGPGGHSWGDAGRPSAIHTLARLITKLDNIQLSSEPKVSLNVGTIEGGYSVNTIAGSATCLIDMRSGNAAALTALVEKVEAAITGASTPEVPVSFEVVGNRPAGEVALDAPIVRLAKESLALVGLDTRVDASSTDANIPLSRGIPAVCIGLTTGANAHRADEFIRIEPLATGVTQLILTTIAVTDALADGTLA